MNPEDIKWDDNDIAWDDQTGITWDKPKTITKQPKSNILKDIGQWAITPTISPETIRQTPVGAQMAGMIPALQMVSGLPRQNFITPQNLMQEGAETVSSETSPLAILSDLTMLKIGQASKVVPKLFRFGGRKTAQAIAESADKGFTNIGKVMSNKYETLFDKIKEGVTPNSPVFEAMRNVVDSYPEAAGVPKLKQIMKRLADVEEISAKELHELKQTVRKSIPKSVWSGTSEADAVQNAMRDVYFKITDSLEQIGGKEYAGLSQEYRKIKESEKLAKKMFYKSGVPSNEPLGKALDVPTEKSIKALDKMLPTEQKFANDFIAWRRGQLAKKVALGGGGVILADYLIRRKIANLLGGGQQQ